MHFERKILKKKKPLNNLVLELNNSLSRSIDKKGQFIII